MGNFVLLLLWDLAVLIAAVKLTRFCVM